MDDMTAGPLFGNIQLFLAVECLDDDIIFTDLTYSMLPAPFRGRRAEIAFSSYQYF